MLAAQISGSTSILSTITASLPRRCAKGRRVMPAPARGLAEWLQGYATAGAGHLVLRFAGDHERHLEIVASFRAELT